MSKGTLLNPLTGKPLFNEEGTLLLDAYRADDLERHAKMNEIRRLLELSKKHPDVKATTRNKFYAGVRPAAATAATARAASAVCWNVSSTQRIQLMELWIANTTTTAYNLSVTRATARGTASTTSTPAAGNSIENDAAPPSGFLIDTAWSVAPTISAVDMVRWNVPAAAGNGIFLPFPDYLAIPPTTGVALITPTALAFQISDITFVIGD